MADKALAEAQDSRSKRLVEAKGRCERPSREHALVKRAPQPAVLAHLPSTDSSKNGSVVKCNSQSSCRCGHEMSGVGQESQAPSQHYLKADECSKQGGSMGSSV